MAGARSVLVVLGAAGHFAGSNTSVVVHWPAPAVLNQSFERLLSAFENVSVFLKASQVRLE